MEINLMANQESLLKNHPDRRMLKKSCFLRFYMDSVSVHIGTYKIASASLLSGLQMNMKKQPLPSSKCEVTATCS